MEIEEHAIPEGADDELEEAEVPDHRQAVYWPHRKGSLGLIAHEILGFAQVLGHEEVQYYSDNEPTLRQVSAC